MDGIDTAVIYGMGGGLLCGGVNWYAKGAPTLDRTGTAQYGLLFASLGCLGGAFAYALLNGSGFDISKIGLFGGFVGSYLLLGLGNYM